MRRIAVLSALCVLPGVLAAPIGRLQAQAARRMPSEILHDVVKGRFQNPQATPNEVEAALKHLLADVQTSGLSAAEEVALGLSYFFTFDGPSARPLLEKHTARDDLLGRASWQALQQMTFVGAKDFQLGERRMVEFRKKFRPIPDDREYTFRMINNLARRSAADGDHARVVRLIIDDVAALPTDLPFLGFDNIGVYFESFRKTGRESEALSLLKKHRDALRARSSSSPQVPGGANAGTGAAAPEFAHKPGVIHLFPFQDGLYDDAVTFTRERATELATLRAVDLYTRWIAAAESGLPLPAR